MAQQKKIKNHIKADHILKNFWKDNSRFADLFNACIFDGEQVLKPNDLTEVDTDISSLLQFNGHAETIQKVLDVVKKTAFGIDFVILGIENQQKVHYAMPLRHMIGDAFSYLKEYNELAVQNKKQKNWRNSDEFLSGLTAEDRLHPMITICIYYGEKEWDGPRSLIDMLKVPERFQALVSDYKMNLIEVRNSEYLKFQNSDVSIVFYISRFIYDKRYDKINDIYKEQLIPSELGLVIGAITESQKLIDDAIKLEKEGGKMNMCKALEELEEKGRIEGRREGEIKGEIKNKILLIQKKSQRGDSMEKIIDDLMESIEFVQPIYEMIKQNPELSVDEIYRIINK